MRKILFSRKLALTVIFIMVTYCLKAIFGIEATVISILTCIWVNTLKNE